jgi:galactokinase
VIEMMNMPAERLQSTNHAVREDLPDVCAFLEMLTRLDDHAVIEAHALFDRDADITVSRAPGRLDVMGGIADYSGSLVLELPIAEATFVALQKQTASDLRIVSLFENESRALTFQMPLSDLRRDGEPISYEEARDYFARNPTDHWAAYVAGVFLVLMREMHVRLSQGANLLISSRVPEGKGVSSSAALEVATMTAVAAAFDISIGPRELALLCQRVENLVVGAPCGVMDQMTSACGEQGQLVALVCQPAELLGTIPIPAGLAFWGLDSGVRHSVGGGDYGSVRVGAFMGYRIIADAAGLGATSVGDRMKVNDSRWRGYLANLTPDEFEAEFVRLLPEAISGEEFVARYGGITDTVTRIELERTYGVRATTAHAVHENFRVYKFAELLRNAVEASAQELGDLMYQSHGSYSACGLGSAETDALVSLVKQSGPTRGLFGAKITGGGSGGTVAILGRADAEGAVREVADKFEKATGHAPYIFRGSSPGSASFGHMVVHLKVKAVDT